MIQHNRPRYIKYILTLVVLTSFAHTQVIKTGTLAPEGSPWHETLQEVGAQWSEMTGGDVSLKIYAGGILGDESDMVRKMRIGQLHAAALSAEGLMYIIPEFDVLRMPMLLRNDEELQYVRNEMTPYYKKLLEERGFILLAWGDAGWAYLYTKNPVIYPQDLNKYNETVFIWAGGSGKKSWTDAGFKTAEVAAPDIFMSLQTGLITTFTTTPIVALSYQWFAMTPYVTDMKAGPLPGAIIVSKKRWNQIPKEKREGLIEYSMEQGDKLIGRISVLEEEATEVMKENGLTVLHAPEDARAEWYRLAKQYMYPEILEAEVPEDVYQMAVEILESYRTSKEQTGE